jgi:hypothetical protein
MSEEDTLENVVDISLDGKPSKEKKKHLSNCEEWAKYAFENNDIYNMVMFQEESLIASIRCTDMTIKIDFIDYKGDEPTVYLTLVYHKFNLLTYFDTREIEYYENKNLFLGEIISYTFDEDRATTKIVFGDGGKAIVTLTKIIPEENTWKTVEQTVNVNVSHNFIRPPQNYKDFEYLLDYRNNIKPEYFDLPNTELMEKYISRTH